MAGIKKLSIKELGKFIREEAAKADGLKDVKTAVDDTDEVEADEYADTLEKPKDHLAGVELNKGLKENKAKQVQVTKYLRSLKSKAVKITQKLKESKAAQKVRKLEEENKKLRAKIRAGTVKKKINKKINKK